jgi:hypothetical protein
MSTRHLEPIPEPYEAAFFAVADQARTQAAANAPEDLRALYLEAESAHPVPRTGHKLARVTAAAASIAAHDLRLRALELVAVGDDAPWTGALAGAGTTLSSWDWDERMQCALNLRATFKDLPQDETRIPTLRGVRLVAAWLTHAGGDGLVPASARLCTHILEHPSPGTIGPAWYAVHGLVLLDAVTAQGDTTPGRATSEQAAYRARLRTVVAGVEAARILTSTALAKRAGITRVTLTSWAQATGLSDPTPATADQR